MDTLTLSRLTGITKIEIGFEEIATRLALAFILSLITAIVYRKTHKSYTFSYNMIVAIILISVLVSMVLMVIDNSLARAFGLVGALAIIRFRTPVKDVRDIIFLFAAVANGIATGAGAFLIAATGTLFANFLAYTLYITRFGGEERADNLLLKIQYTGRSEVDAMFKDILVNYCKSYSLIELLKGEDFDNEYIYSIKLQRDEGLAPLTDEISGLEEVNRVSVLSAMHNMDVQ